MYLATAAPARFGSLGTCDPDLATAATDAARLERIKRAIECELRLEFPTSTHPGLIERRRRLRGLVRAVPAALASALQRELEQNVTTLARLFWTRLHTATSKELLSILCQTFFKEYELRFNPLADTFSVPNNPLMSPQDKTDRIADVASLVGDVVNAPGLLWSRVLKRVDAALDGVGLVPTSLPRPARRVPRNARLSGASPRHNWRSSARPSPTAAAGSTSPLSRRVSSVSRTVSCGIPRCPVTSASVNRMAGTISSSPSSPFCASSSSRTRRSGHERCGRS